MSIEYMELTSTHDTPLFIRKDVVLYIEGFTIDAAHDPKRVGTRLTLLAGQWSENVVCLENVRAVFKRLIAEN